MEQRYHSVMEAVSGSPVMEVARRYGVSRQAVHMWLGKYQREGIAGPADDSHCRRFQPRQTLRGDRGVWHRAYYGLIRPFLIDAPRAVKGALLAGAIVLLAGASFALWGALTPTTSLQPLPW